jgi:acyl carrier protein
MKEKVFNDLVEFIHKQTGSHEIPITKETSLENDLGVTGDDGEDLIIEFGRKYNVNITNFLFTKYFYPEPLASSALEEIKALTVGDLVKAIEAGRLDDEIITRLR